KLDQFRHPFARSHWASSGVGSCSSSFLLINPLARRNSRRAHENSLPRTSSPSGITIKAGPGSMSNAIPISTIVPPITPTTTRRNVFGNKSQPNRVPRFRVHFTPALYRTRAMLQLVGELREFLAELRWHVRDDERVVAFVS